MNKGAVLNKKTGFTVLIVDDSPTDRKIYHRFLESFGWTILDASTAKEGLELCAESNVDCILLDYRMPQVTGLSVVPLFKQICQAPIILISGEPDPLIVSESYRVGVAAFLNKEFVSSAALKEAISKAVSEI